MNAEMSHRVQAWIDGELDESGVRQLASLVETNPEARALERNLRTVRDLIRHHEPHRTVPESREFYWSTLRRRLEAEEPPEAPAARPPRQPIAHRWLAWLIPAGAAALALAFFLHPPAPSPSTLVSTMSGPPLMANHQIETPPSGLYSLTFYDAEQGMTVVWLGKVDLF